MGQGSAKVYVYVVCCIGGGTRVWHLLSYRDTCFGCAGKGWHVLSFVIFCSIVGTVKFLALAFGWLWRLPKLSHRMRESAAQTQCSGATWLTSRRSHKRTSGRCAGEARVHSGEVLAWCGERARHHVLYDDGEDEWLDLGAERLVWHAPRGAPPVAAGLPDGAGLACPRACTQGVFWFFCMSQTCSSCCSATLQGTFVTAIGKVISRAGAHTAELRMRDAARHALACSSSFFSI